LRRSPHHARAQAPLVGEIHTRNKSVFPAFFRHIASPAKQEPKRGCDELRLEADLQGENLGRMAMAGLFLTILLAPLPVMLILAGRELLWHHQPAPAARKTIPISIRARR
jgi:hypothetical protein